MLAARNRRFRIAALFAGAAYLIGAVGALIDANRIFGLALPGGYKVSAAIFPAAQLIGVVGWLIVAAAFGAEIDWRRLRIGGTILASAYIAMGVASVLRSISELGDVHESHARLGYIASAVAVVLAAAAASTIVSGFVESRRGKPRAIRLRAGAALWILSGLGIATAALLFQSSFAHLGGPHQLITGSTLLAIGGLGNALAALVVALAVTRPLGRREAGVAGAATIAVAAILCAAGGESLVATSYPLSGSSLWIAWLSVAVRVTLAVAIACVALGARTASTPPLDAVST
jgi:hypothetical protein